MIYKKLFLRVCYLLSICLVVNSCDSPTKNNFTDANTKKNNSVASYLKQFDNYAVPKEGKEFSNKYRTASTNFNWEELKKYTLHLKNGGDPKVYLPYDGRSSSPAKDDIGLGDVQEEDGWRLLWKNFGERNRIKTPLFALYNIFTAEVKVFFYNADTISARSKFLVKITTENTSSEESKNPSILNIYDDSQIDGDKHVETYASTEVSQHQWAYFNFFITGYDEEIGTGKYQNEFISMEVIGFEETQIDLSGDIVLDAFYNSGQSNIITNTKDMLDKLPSEGSKITKYLKNYSSTEESNEDLEEQADGDQPLIDKVANLAGLTLSKYVPALSELSGFIGKAIGGKAGGSLSRLSGDITLKGQASTSFNNLTNMFITIPGVQTSNEMPSALYPNKTGIFSLTSNLDTYNYDKKWRCNEGGGRRPGDCRKYSLSFSYKFSNDLAESVEINPIFSNIGYEVAATASVVPANEYFPESDYLTFSELQNRSGFCSYSTTGSGSCQEELTIKVDILKNNSIESTYFKTYPILINMPRYR